MSTALTIHPDRLFPADPTTRAIARSLYGEVQGLPIISPHGHVPAQWLADDVGFADPTSMLITPDHYVTRLLHASGVTLEELGVGVSSADFTSEQSRAAFRALCEHWPVFRGTPMKLWLESQLVDIFEIDQVPSAQTADSIYDGIQGWIDRDSSRVRTLLERFDIAFMATTDDPCDDLVHHRVLAEDPTFTRTVVPTFRPDRYLEPAAASWNGDIDRLAEASETDCGTYAGWVAAMEHRREFFATHGCVSTDHSHSDLGTATLKDDEAEKIYAQARAGRVLADQATALRRHMVSEMARMATEDGMTMTLHPGVARNHHPGTFQRFGADVGGDIPVGVEVTRALQPLLARYGTHPNFTLVVFTIDETVYSRELGPLAGFYPCLRVGVPWWFIDAPDAIRRFRRAVTESAGLTRTSGFIDDTRAFLSIPARHDMSRRLDCGYLAELVADHRLTHVEAHEAAHYLVSDQPREVFGL